MTIIPGPHPNSHVGSVLIDARGRMHVGTLRPSGGDIALFWQLVEKEDGTLTYCRANGPPVDWRGLKVIDEETGAEIPGVVECNADEGWLHRMMDGDDGDPWPVLCSGKTPCYRCGPRYDHIKIGRLEGKFRILRPALGAVKP